MAGTALGISKQGEFRYSDVFGRQRFANEERRGFLASNRADGCTRGEPYLAIIALPIPPREQNRTVVLSSRI